MTEDEVRAIIRDEIASLAGLALRRTQDMNWTRSNERNLAMEIVNREAAQFWGEVLVQYGKDLPPEVLAERAGAEATIEDTEGNVVGFKLPKE